MLLRTPGFSFAAALVLALGLGATTAIFTLVERLLLSPLPYPDADRLVWIWNVPPTSGAGMRSLFGNDLDEIRRESHIFESVGGAFPGTWNVTGVGEPLRLAGARVTADFFPTLGIRPQTGRLFLPEEYHTGREMVAIFSYSFWQNHLGGDPNILGRRISMDGVSFEIVGVMPKDFALSADADLWAPLPVDSPYIAGTEMAMGAELRTAETQRRTRAGSGRIERNRDGSGGEISGGQRIRAEGGLLSRPGSGIGPADVVDFRDRGGMRAADRVRQCRKFAAGARCESGA